MKEGGLLGNLLNNFPIELENNSISDIVYDERDISTSVF